MTRPDFEDYYFLNFSIFCCFCDSSKAVFVAKKLFVCFYTALLCRFVVVIAPLLKVIVGDFCMRIVFLWLKSNGLWLPFRNPLSFLAAFLVVLLPMRMLLGSLRFLETGSAVVIGCTTFLSVGVG